MMHGEKSAEQFVATAKNKLGRFPLGILEDLNIKAAGHKALQDEGDKQLLRFVFAYWGNLRRSLSALQWVGLYDERNIQLEAYQRKTLMDIQPLKKEKKHKKDKDKKEGKSARATIV